MIMAGRPRKTPRPRSGKARSKTSIAIQERLRRLLVAAADRNGDSINREIENRLRVSFADELDAQRRTTEAAE
jgi:predicted HicB family RNase H-like nuclease